MANKLLTRLEAAEIPVKAVSEQQLNRFPWYIKSMLALSGWLGALFIMAMFFFAFSSLLDSEVTCLLMSLLMLVIANRVLSSPSNEFVEHLALALSIAAQALFVVAVIPLDHDELILLVLALFQATLVVVMPSMMHRVWSTLCCCFALEAVLTPWGLPHFLTSFMLVALAWLVVNEFRLSKWFQLVSGIKFGVVVTLIVLTCTQIFGLDSRVFFDSFSPDDILLPTWAAAVAYVVSIMISTRYLLNYIAIDIRTSKTKLALVMVFALALLTSFAPGMGICVVILLLAYVHSDRVMLGLGVLGLIKYSSTYYYSLEYTLLVKAGVLMLTALLMLLCHWVFNNILVQARED